MILVSRYVRRTKCLNIKNMHIHIDSELGLFMEMISNQFENLSSIIGTNVWHAMKVKIGEPSIAAESHRLYSTIAS